MDSNLYPRDSNPRWRKKWSWRPRIRILKIWIWISHEEQVKRLKLDSNPLHNYSNPWIWSYEEQVKAIWIFELQIRISSPKMKLKVEGQTEGFESLSYGESFLGVKFKFYKGDLNPLHSDSNPPLCKSIKCTTYNSNNPIFKSNFSHKG